MDKTNIPLKSCFGPSFYCRKRNILERAICLNHDCSDSTSNEWQVWRLGYFFLCNNVVCVISKYLSKLLLHKTNIVLHLHLFYILVLLKPLPRTSVPTSFSYVSVFTLWGNLIPIMFFLQDLANAGATKRPTCCVLVMTHRVKGEMSPDEQEKLKSEYSQVATEVSELAATIFWDKLYRLPFFFFNLMIAI